MNENLQVLINEYNAAEAVQNKRLEAIFLLINSGAGMRRVVFSNGQVWSNCWNRDLLHENVLPQEVYNKSCLITSVEGME